MWVTGRPRCLPIPRSRSAPPACCDRVEAGVRSATLTSHRDTPAATVQPLLDACIEAGIPADRLKLDSAAVPD
jgi:hypothetical protein